jgi:hypothetical protein
MKDRAEFYISIDGETDGPCPLVNSLLQFGACFYDNRGNLLHKACWNIKPIVGGVQDPNTMKWWGEQETKNPGLWASMVKDQVEPVVAMQEFVALIEKYSRSFKASPVCAAYPAGFDFTWLYCYLCKFLGESAVGFSCLDMKTLGMALENTTFLGSTKRNYPVHWFNRKLKHTHNAGDDALGQGYMLFQMFDDLALLHESTFSESEEQKVEREHREGSYGDSWSCA